MPGPLDRISWSQFPASLAASQVDDGDLSELNADMEVAVPRRRKHPTQPAEQHTHLVIRVESYEASVGASVNPTVYAPQYASALDENDPLYKLTTRLTITGVSTYPEDRAGDIYEVTIYGDGAPSRRLDATLSDMHVRNEYGAPQYRTYRGRQIPVFESPKGLGLIDKVRGERRWTAWLFVQPAFATDAMGLLGHDRQLYIAVHERKVGRTRWLQGLDLQTTDPAEE